MGSHHIKKTERYKSCRECGFWVQVKDTYCPNCGIITPLWKIPLAKWRISKNSIFLGGGLYLLVKGFLIFLQQSFPGLVSNLGSLLRGTALTGLFFGAATATVQYLLTRAKHQKITQSLQRRSPSSLKDNEDAITQRLEEIQTRETQIRETLKEIGQTTESGQFQKSLAALKSSFEALQIQRKRYIAKLWQVVLIRWYNALKPLTEDTRKLTYDTCNDRIIKIKEVIQNGMEMIEAWKQHSDLTRSQQQCIIRLRKALNTCKQVHQDLLSHKAALAVKGVSPLNEQAYAESEIVTSLEELDAFSLLPDLGEFTAGIKALDTEYFRLKGEEEIYQEFEKEES